MTELWLTEEQMDQEIEANRLACQRFDRFDRSDAGWEEIWEGLYAILIEQMEEVREAFDLDPRKSSLFDTYPDLLWATCHPQKPIVYSPAFREFGMPVFDGGPAMITMDFDPWTGKALPPPLRDTYFEEAEKLLGHEVGIFDDALDTLPDVFRSEAWWLQKGF